MEALFVLFILLAVFWTISVFPGIYIKNIDDSTYGDNFSGHHLYSITFNAPANSKIVNVVDYHDNIVYRSDWTHYLDTFTIPILLDQEETDYVIQTTIQRGSKQITGNLSITTTACMSDSVQLRTSQGIITADKMKVGDSFLQPDGTYSRCIKISIQHKHEYDNTRDDSRFYSNLDEKVQVTYYHKILYKGEWVYPKDHPEFKEIDKCNTVYHAMLEKPTDVLIAVTTKEDMVLESWYIKEDV